jgi:hypothetical protein
LWHGSIAINSCADENDELQLFSFSSKPMNVAALKSVPFIEVLFPSVGALSAGLHSLPVTQFQLSSSGADFNCSRVVFDYLASLFCDFLNGTSSNNVAFFLGGAVAYNSAQVAFTGRTRASCRFQVEGWKFSTVGTCQIRVSIPVLAISALTPSFSVDAGPAQVGSLLGFLPSQVSGASIIWSTNSSGIPCIAALLSDAFSNPASNSQAKFYLSAFRLGTLLPYELFGETSVKTDGAGVARWCNVRASAVSSEPICLRLFGANLNWTLPTCINVSRAGVATALSWGNSSAVLNSTTPVVSGAGLPKMRIVVSDAAGNIASNSGQRIVIRLRVMRTVFNESSSV